MSYVAKERGILFRGDLVRAILEGRKTQTRRPLRFQPKEGHGVSGCHWVKTGWAECALLPNGKIGGCFCGMSERIHACPAGHVFAVSA